MKTPTEHNKLHFESAYWLEHPGLSLAGVDEAGRGCLAGPVAAGAVMMEPEVAATYYAGTLAGVNDSKQLSEHRREEFFSILTSSPGIVYAVGLASAHEIDQLNILRATHLAMARAVTALSVLPSHVLVDGLPVKGLPVPHTAIVKGDAKSFLIACASIIAKVTRDHLMLELDQTYPQYGFASHKGYGSHEHTMALLHHGPCPAHRMTFRPVADSINNLPGFSL